MRPSLLATAVAVGAAASVGPKGFHLAFGGPSAMTVSFTLNASSSTCNYGVTGQPLTSVSTSDVITYLGGSIHHALMTGLSPGTFYSYSCAGSSPVSFLAPPSQSLNDFSFITFGDWGYLGSKERGPSLPVGGLYANWSAVPVRELLETLKDNITLVLHTGDIVYADDAFGEHPLEFQYENVNDGWFDWISNVSASRPYMVSVGNHESECHSPLCLLDPVLGEAERNFTAYNARWRMPSSTSSGVLNMWHSFDVGAVHFVALNTETDFEGAEESNTGDGHFPWLTAGHFAPDGAYLAWLAADLRAAAANPSVEYIIAHGHRPFEDLPSAHAATLSALFQEARVDLYFAGHGHSYARYDAAAWDDGTVHIMAGGAGCDEMGWPSDQLASSPRATDDVPARCAAWCEAFEASAAARNATERACHFCNANGASPVATSGKYALGLVDVAPDAITFSLLRAPDGALLDTVTVPKKNRRA